MSMLATVPIPAPIPVPILMPGTMARSRGRRGRPPKVAAVRPQLVVPSLPPDVLKLLPLVRKIASWFERRYSLPAGWDHDDLVSEGVLGLLRATAKYDPTRPCSLETYAGYWIRGILWRALKERWTQLNNEAPPSDDDMEGPWLPPERAVLCREIIDIVGNLGVAEQTLVYGCITDQTLSSLARQLDIPITTALRRHLKALVKVRQAAGSRYNPATAVAA